MTPFPYRYLCAVTFPSCLVKSTGKLFAQHLHIESIQRRAPYRNVLKYIPPGRETAKIPSVKECLSHVVYAKE